MKHSFLLGLFGLLDAENNFARRCELYRVSSEIDDNLAQTRWISNQVVRNVRKNMTRKFQAPLIGAQAQHSHGVTETLAKAEINCLHNKFAGFDLREVQNVVQKGKQRVGG